MRRAVAWFALVAAVLVVEFGWRAPVGGGVELGTPGFAAGVLDRLRSAPFDAIDDHRAAAMVSGVVLGRTDGIDAGMQATFLDSGLWHLVAASGQNVGLLAMLCLGASRLLRAPRALGAALAVLAITTYVFVVGSGASIVRAGLLAIGLLLASITGRSADARHVLVVTAALICWIWPGAHRSLGMQLSYACVIALMWRGDAWTRALVERGTWRWLAALLAATAICGLVTAPILAIRTGSAPLTATAANVIAVPLAGAILVVGLIGVVISAAGASWMAWLVLLPVSWAATALMRIAERAAAIPAAQLTDVPVLVGVPVLIGAAMLVHDRVRTERMRRVLLRVCIGSAGALLVWSVLATWAPRVGVSLPGAAARASPRTAGTLRMAVLDIGQGDATLLVSDAGAILVDVGPPDGEVVRRVRQMGVGRIEGIVLTHDSLDHRGGFDAAVAALRPKWVAKPVHSPGPWRRILAVSPRVHELCAGSSLDLGRDVSIELRNPPCDGRVVQRTDDVHNDGAMVLVIRHGEVTMLVPADAEAPVLRRLGLPHADVLRVSHHGSSDPELARLLEEITPAAAAISAGEGNDYGHPRADTLHTLSAAGARTYRTDRDGSIVFDSDGSRVTVELVARR